MCDVRGNIFEQLSELLKFILNEFEELIPNIRFQISDFEDPMTNLWTFSRREELEIDSENFF